MSPTIRGVSLALLLVILTEVEIRANGVCRARWLADQTGLPVIYCGIRLDGYMPFTMLDLPKVCEAIGTTPVELYEHATRVSDLVASRPGIE